MNIVFSTPTDDKDHRDCIDLIVEETCYRVDDVALAVVLATHLPIARNLPQGFNS